jgi:hypothetical protein
MFKHLRQLATSRNTVPKSQRPSAMRRQKTHPHVRYLAILRIFLKSEIIIGLQSVSRGLSPHLHLRPRAYRIQHIIHRQLLVPRVDFYEALRVGGGVWRPPHLKICIHGCCWLQLSLNLRHVKTVSEFAR